MNVMVIFEFWLVWFYLWLWCRHRQGNEAVPILSDDMSLKYMCLLMNSGVRGRRELQFLGVRHKTLLLYYPVELAKRKRFFAALREEQKNKLIEEQREQKKQLRDETNRKALEKLDHDIEARQARESVIDYYFGHGKT